MDHYLSVGIVDDATVAAERAIDQLVDELSSRIHDLRCLLADRSDSSAWPAADVRRGAVEIIERLHRPSDRERTAAALLKALWPATASADIPHHWFTTPLGVLLGEDKWAARPPAPPVAARATAVGRCDRHGTVPAFCDTGGQGDSVGERFDARLVGPLIAGRAARVDVDGEVDLASVAVLRETLDAAIAATTEDIDVDMSATTFCDSTGLCALLTARHRLQGLGRLLRIVNPSPPVARLLTLSDSRELLGDPVAKSARTCVRPADFPLP